MQALLPCLVCKQAEMRYLTQLLSAVLCKGELSLQGLERYVRQEMTWRLLAQSYDNNLYGKTTS